MSNLYEDFDDSNDDMAENDDDIGALGSILSWDDDEENARNSLQAPSLSKDRESNGSAPPDLLQFNIRDGEFNFAQYGGLGSQIATAKLTAASGGADGSGSIPQRITLQLPLPTPVSALNQSAAGRSAPANDSRAPSSSSQDNTQQSRVPQQNSFVLPQGPLMNQLAQLLAQQASNLLQQQHSNSQQMLPSQPTMHRQENLLQQTQAGQDQSNSLSQAHAASSQQRAQQIPQPSALQQVQSSMQQAQQQQLQQQRQQLQQQKQQQQVQQLQAQQLQAQQQQAQQQQAQQQQAQQQQAMQVLQRLAIHQQQQQQQVQQQLESEHQMPYSQGQGMALPSHGQNTSTASQQTQFGTDSNTLLQQLQYAQLQQQYQAAQAQANAQSGSAPAVQIQQSVKPPPHVPAVKPSPAGPSAEESSAIQEQLKMHFNLAQKQQAVLSPTPPVSRSSDVVAAKKPKSISAKDGAKKPPATKKSQTNSVAASKTAGTSTLLDPTTSGLVTASDTDGEVSRRAKKSKIADGEVASTSAAMDADDFDDEESDAADAKVKTNRDRNREHARNTRLRKKAYLEKLKVTVDDLCRERDTLVSERAGAAKLLVEMHNTRTEVLMSLFALRSTNEKRRELWSSILDESCFACVMPVTPYRSFPASEVQVSKCQRTVMGIDGMIADTASLHVLFASLVDRSIAPLGRIDFRYTLITEEAVVAGNQMMARWVMSTTNAVQCGAKMEVSKHGMLCCRFNSGHRITGLELMFDVMAFMLQLKQAAGTDAISVIPNTVQTCQRTFDKPVVMTLAEPPYTIVQVNKLWEQMTGYTAEEVVGKASCAILQGAKTDRADLDRMMQEIRFKRPVSAILTNVKKSGEVFRHCLLLFPLSTDSRITHYLAITDHAETEGSMFLQHLVDQPHLIQQSMQQFPMQGRAQISAPQTLQLPGMIPPVVVSGLSVPTLPMSGQANFPSASQASFGSLPMPIAPGQAMPPPPGPTSEGSGLKRPHSNGSS